MKTYNAPTFSVAYEDRDGFQFDDLLTKDIYRIKQVKAGGCTIDIGANIGTISLLLAIDRGCTVFALEPDPRNYALFGVNILNNLSRCAEKIIPINKAISDTSGTQKFYSREDHSGGSHLGANISSESPEVPGYFKYPIAQHSGSFREVDVNCLTLRALFYTEKIGVCDFMKLDCEGAEYLVFQESNTEIFRDRVKQVAFECHSDSADHCVRFLQQAGFLVDNPDYVIGKVIHATRKDR